jgi:hypothetical protein
MDFGGQTEGKNHFEEKDVDGILKIKYLLKKLFWKAIDLSASDYGQVAEFCEQGNEHSDCTECVNFVHKFLAFKIHDS